MDYEQIVHLPYPQLLMMRDIRISRHDKMKEENDKLAQLAEAEARKQAILKQ